MMIMILNELFSNLTWKYLINDNSHCKNSISFIDIRNMIMLHAKKTVVSKKYEDLSFTILQSTIQTGTENIYHRLAE